MAQPHPFLTDVCPDRKVQLLERAEGPKPASFSCRAVHTEPSSWALGGFLWVCYMGLPFLMVFAKPGLEHTHGAAPQLRPFSQHGSWALNHHREHFMPSWTWAELASAQSSALRMTSSSETLRPRAQDPP